MRGYKSFESDPRPGDLRHLIEIGYTDNEINENGYPEPVDTVVCKVWASAIEAGNQTFRAADTENAEGVINFTVRYRSGLQPGMWVKFLGEKRVITTMGEYEFKRRYLGLKTSVVKGVG